MKKALAILLASALVGSVFAAEPAAELKLAEFTGDAAVVFKADINTGMTGFKNETSGKVQLNLLKGGDKSTTGDGIWGELKIKFDGMEIEAKTDKQSTLNDKKVTIEVAQIHFGPVYMGIKEGGMEYGGDYWYPNALNYKDDKDKHSRKPSKDFGYNQGFLVGYKMDDLFKVEVALRSKKDVSKKLDKLEPTLVKKDAEIKLGEYYTAGATDAFSDATVVGTVANGKKKLSQDYILYKAVMKDDKTEYLTNKYALGFFAEAKPIKDLRITTGLAYAFGRVDRANWQEKENDNRHDISFFSGAEYKLGIGEKYALRPVVTYTLEADAKYLQTGKELHENTYFYDKDLKTSFLGTGIHFGWGGEKDNNSQLKSFFGKKGVLFYNTEKEDDKKLLPGVGLYAGFDLGTKTNYNYDNPKTAAVESDVKTDNNIDKNLPIMVTFFSGDLIKDLKVAAIFGVNAAKDASKSPGGAAPFGYAAAKGAYDTVIGARGLQFGAAASYDVKLGDITIVPAFGVLWTHATVKGDSSKIPAFKPAEDAIDNTRYDADEVRFGASVDVKGVIQNTTLSMFWENAAYGKGVSSAVASAGLNEDVYYTNNHGQLGVKVKIAF